MTWYETYNESSRHINSLLDTKPSLANLLTTTDFIQHLKSFNPKLINYLNNTPSIPQDLITYLTIPPTELDSPDRKYKLPLLAIEMLELQKNSIADILLKPTNQGKTYFLKMFDMLKHQPILPILTGYFNRCTLQLCHTRYKQTIQQIYTSLQYLQLLIQHSYHQPLSNILLLYLAIPLTTTLFLSQDKSTIQLTTLKTLITKIEISNIKNNQNSYLIIENLCDILREIIQRHHSINNGEQMLEILLTEKTVNTILSMIKQQTDNSFSAMTLTLSYLKYYSLSPLNTNINWLDAQPFIKQISIYFRTFITKIKRQKTLTLYHYRLLQVLCHCITLPSDKIFTLIKQTQLFPALLDFLFKHQSCNIFHHLLQRTFLHIFTTRKPIYQKYKQFLFCDLSIIDLTAKKILDLFPQNDCFNRSKKKAYFGPLMKIIKIYCSLTTLNPLIVTAITSKTDIWNKILKNIIQPYQILQKSQIGHLQNIPQNSPTEFTIRHRSSQTLPTFSQSISIIQQIKRQQQTMPKAFENNTQKKIYQDFSQQQLNNNLFFENIFQKNFNHNHDNTKNNNFFNQSFSNTSYQKPNTKKSTSFYQFMNKKKQQLGQQIKMHRSHLSANKKTRLQNSPFSLRNSCYKQKQSLYLTPTLPKAYPTLSHKLSTPSNLSQSTYSIKSTQQKLDYTTKQKPYTYFNNNSNLQFLKNTTIIHRTDTPYLKKYRNIQEKDRNLLAYLGLRF